MIRFLSTADTEVQALAAAVRRLPEGFAPVRAGNPNDLLREGALDRFSGDALDGCRVLIVRVLGGKPYFSEGFERLSRVCRDRGIAYFALPGEEALDPELTALCHAPLPLVTQVLEYLSQGGVENLVQLLRCLSDNLFLTAIGYDPPTPLPREGIHAPSDARDHDGNGTRPVIGIIFYRTHWMSGNTAPIDALADRIASLGGRPLPLFCYSLKDDAGDGVPAVVRKYLLDENGRSRVDVLISTLSFTAAHLSDGTHTEASGPIVDVFDRLDVPILQAVLCTSREEEWAASTAGLTPRDTAMNVVLPEFDGRINTVAISFKEEGRIDENLGVAVKEYAPKADRIDHVARLAMRFARLRRTPSPQKKIAILFGNYPSKNARIGNGVGLDTPASVMNLLRAMQEEGYAVDDLPADGDALMHRLIDRCTHDEEFLSDEQMREAVGHVSLPTYDAWFNAIPARSRRAMVDRWGIPLGTVGRIYDRLAIPGLVLGNVFVGIQPPRGFGADPMAIYHSPDLPPTHHYLAYYRWIRDEFGADAVVHMGKHGNLEWLPGKATALSGGCYPEVMLDDLPNFYPYIINNPGEGTQAKRRAHAVVIDHLIPATMRADTYDDLLRLEQLIDEYYRMAALDPSKLPIIFDEIWELYVRNNLHRDLNSPCGPVGAVYKPGGLSQAGPTHTHRKTGPRCGPSKACGHPERPEAGRIDAFLQEVDGYLCELGDAQVRDGLHILGEPPAGDQRIELIQSLMRLANGDVPSIRDAVAIASGVDAAALSGPMGDPIDDAAARALVDAWATASSPRPTRGDLLRAVDACGRSWITTYLEYADTGRADHYVAMCEELVDNAPEQWAAARDVAFLANVLLPALDRTTDEIANLLRGLAGRFVPAGPSGAPTRGMARILPTGRNFYSVDIHTIPTETAWRVGVQAGDRLIQKYREENGGSFPRSVGIVVWGTSTMRTHGDDVAEILHLMGCRPVWAPESRRVTGVELIPLSELGRPRIDVTVRISGFFRDAFPNVVALIDRAVEMVADADENAWDNYLRHHVLREAEALSLKGQDPRPARYRVFGSKPGAYGAGLLNLIDERNWKTDADLANVYITWGSYAYTRTEPGVPAAEPFKRRLSQVAVAVQNQDNREHDIFDSDDYFQYHGGMIAAIRSLTGANPASYFGDTSNPANVRVRDIQEEAYRVFRSRVVNPKWIASAMRHGYKGASEMAATVDYLFGFEATAQVIDDWMFADLSRSYLLDRNVREFLQEKNPWALRSMAERLLEAVDRGMWQAPEDGMVEALRAIYLVNEGTLEGRS